MDGGGSYFNTGQKRFCQAAIPLSPSALMFSVAMMQLQPPRCAGGRGSRSDVGPWSESVTRACRFQARSRKFCLRKPGQSISREVLVGVSSAEG
jgi:hypothetical protein